MPLGFEVWNGNALLLLVSAASCRIFSWPSARPPDYDRPSPYSGSVRTFRRPTRTAPCVQPWPPASEKIWFPSPSRRLRLGTRHRLGSFNNNMKYRGIEYTVVQGIGRQLWKWSVSVADVVTRGQAATKSEAVAEAERAIEGALSPKQLRLVPREDRD